MGKLGNLETELKYRLSATDYRRLMKSVPKPQRTLQLRNLYFDDAKFSLRRLGIGFRLRLVNQRRAILTLKLPHVTNQRSPAALKIRQEFEETLPWATARKIQNGELSLIKIKSPLLSRLRRLLPTKVMAGLECLGEMEMSRTKTPLSPRLELEIDTFTVFGKTYYELEVETEDPFSTDREVKALLKNTGSLAVHSSFLS